MELELVGDKTVNIAVRTTVPLAIPGCSQILFKYKHAVGVTTTACHAYFSERLSEHTLSIRVKPTPGCITYNSLMQFKPHTKPDNSIWENYVPSNITVRQ